MVTFAKALSEWATLLPGVSEPQALEEHEEAGPWGALTGRSGTRVPTRASLGLGPGRRGCQGPILGAVRTHYPHLCAGTMASPVPPCHPEVDETVRASCPQLWFPGPLPWEGCSRTHREPRSRERRAGGGAGPCETRHPEHLPALAFRTTHSQEEACIDQLPCWAVSQPHQP